MHSNFGIRRNAEALKQMQEWVWVAHQIEKIDSGAYNRGSVQDALVLRCDTVLCKQNRPRLRLNCLKHSEIPEMALMMWFFNMLHIFRCNGRAATRCFRYRSLCVNIVKWRKTTSAGYHKLKHFKLPGKGGFRFVICPTMYQYLVSLGVPSQIVDR